MNADAHPLRLPIVTAFGAALVVAMVGLVMTDLGPWYLNLKMPPWKPPDSAFGPAWTLIFATAALGGAYGWRALQQPSARIALCAYFAINAVLNIFWSALFFRLHRPDWALLEVGLLWLSIVVLMVTLWRGSRAATWWLLPYLVWVSYAAILNLAVVRLNPA